MSGFGLNFLPFQIVDKSNCLRKRENRPKICKLAENYELAELTELGTIFSNRPPTPTCEALVTDSPCVNLKVSLQQASVRNLRR